MALTLNPGTMIVASAYPDPPFDLMENGSATGFDIELMRAICTQLGLGLRPVPYSGDDFNGIFDGLAKSNLRRSDFGNYHYPRAVGNRAIFGALS
jgi:polar amino acid transport system substrate-binding protein